MAAKISAYMPNANGSRRRSLEVDGVQVFVEPHEDDARSLAVAEFLRDAPAVVDSLRAEVQRLRALVPPAEPVRLGHGGCVRFRDGKLWLLNRREDGWSSFGVQLRGWDDLFRRFNAIVTEHGSDAFGPFWVVAPPDQSKGGDKR